MLSLFYIYVKKILYIFLINILLIAVCQANVFCAPKTVGKSKHALICKSHFKDERVTFMTLLSNVSLMTNAPLTVLNVTQNMWQDRIYTCKNKACIQQELSLRTDELNELASLNQSLTKHFIKYNQGAIAKPHTLIQIHQLDKNRIKIEGISYKNLNQHTNHHTFLAYSPSSQSIDILNNEDSCKYHFQVEKAILNITSEQKQCQQFVGVYRLYD